MRYNDLITTPAELLEAQLTPGQVKAIEIKINDYEEELRKLKYKKYDLDDKFVHGDFPKELKDKVDAYVAAYTKAIDELQNKLKQSSANPQFDNFIAGIKKNCSDIVSLYQSRGRVFYTGFKISGQTALYGKPDARLNLGDYHSNRNGEEVQWLIENLFDDMSFDNAVFATSDSYEASKGSRNPYIIFPRNGFKYFWSLESSGLNIPDQTIWRLFDEDVLMGGWNKFVNDPEMLAKFRAAGAEISYEEKTDIKQPDGFMGKYAWESQLRAIRKLVESGDLAESWLDMTKWTSWVTKESFNKLYDMQTDDLTKALSYGHDCIINTSGVYALNQKYRNQVFKALNII